MKEFKSHLLVLDKLGLPDNHRQEAGAILEKHQNSPLELELINKIFTSEVSQTYLEPGHFSKTYLQKQLLTHDLVNDISRLITLLYPKKHLNNPSRYLGDQTDYLGMAINAIEKRGFWQHPNLVQPDVITSIIERLRSVPFYMRNSLRKVQGYQHTTAEEISQATAWVNDQQDILSIPEVQQLVMDPLLFNISSHYLDTEPIHVQTNCWWSTPAKPSRHSMSANAQLFNQDTEFVKFLKVFIYLNDVTEENGAHVYVEGSHRDNRMKMDPNYKMADRVDDDVIKAEYGPDKIIPMTGRAGTVVVEDTSGFHKGMPVIKGHRLLLQIEYANCLYFNSTEAFSDKNLGPDFQKFLADHARFSLKYDDERYRSDMMAMRRRRFVKNLRGYGKSVLKNLLGK